MANFASINSEFSDFSVLDSFFQIKFVNAVRSIDVTYTWTAKSLRTSSFEYTQGTDGGDQGYKSFIAVNADITNSAISAFMNVSIFIDAFEIEANEFGWVITDEGSTGTTNITLTEVPEVQPAKDFQLIDDTKSNSPIFNPACTHIRVGVRANSDGVAPYTWVNPALSSTTFAPWTYAEIARQATNQSISITVEDADTDQATRDNVLIPRLFTAVEISSISVVTNQGGFDATVTVFMADLVTFGIFTYSLDGTNYFTSNIFSNVVDGSYTLYVKEQYGCIITQAFDVDTAQSIPRRNPYALVPKANSFRFVQTVSKQYNTLENTLYQDYQRKGQYQPWYAAPYQTNDGIITNQFRSNYDELSARILDCSGNIIDTLSVTQKSDNLGAQDKRDCIAFNRGNNQSGVYFTIGNIYDPGTLDIIDTYELNGNLPEWGVIGNTMVLTGVVAGSYVIKQVIYDSTLQAYALIFDYAWQSGNQTEAVIAEVTYDRLPYEAYEFDFDLGQAPLLDGTYYAQILMTDSLDEYPAIAWNSEWINIKDEHDSTNVIEFSVAPFSGIDYSTGIVGKVRLLSADPYTDLTPGGESTEYDDSLLETVKLKDVATMEGAMFFQSQPRYMIEKLRIIFTHKTILINGEQWTNIEGLETENFRLSALKNATIKLRRNDYEQYATDNIDVDGDKSTLLQETGSILI